MEIVQWILVILLIAWAVWNGYRQHKFALSVEKIAAECRSEFAAIPQSPGRGTVPSGPTGLP
jgi:hypothetical protein